MGLFSFLSKAADKPYKNDAFNQIYNLLFCDDISLFRTTEAKKTEYPWSILSSPNATKEQLQKIASDKSLETRARILAYRELTKEENILDKQLLGVIIEIGLPEGLDVLAAYSDGTARYINHSQKLVAWEAPTNESNALIQKLLENSLNASNQIGLWDKKRKPHPSKDNVRITFLLSHGIAFGEGQCQLLSQDEIGGPILSSATQLMMFLTQQQK